MAKAPRNTAPVKPVSPLAADTAIIAKDFARSANHNIDDTARAAILRHVTDKEAFNLIRIASLTEWAIARASHLVQTGTKGDEWEPRELSRNDAKAIFDGTTQGMSTTIGKKPKRDAFTQSLYEFGKMEWSRYLAANEIDTLNAEKKTRAPRAPKGNTEKPDANPQSPDAFLVLESAATMADVIKQAHKPEAFLARLVSAHAKVIRGDAGERLRALAAHVQKELKIIEALNA